MGTCELARVIFPAVVGIRLLQEPRRVLVCDESDILIDIPVIPARVQVVEKLNLLESSNGTVLHSEIVGAIKMKVWIGVRAEGIAVALFVVVGSFPGFPVDDYAGFP